MDAITAESPAPFVWDEKNLAEATAAWARKTPASEIAAQIGTTKNSVIGKMHRLGLKHGEAPRPEPVEKLPYTPPPQPPTRPLFGRRPLIEAGMDQCRYPLWNDGDTHRDVCGQRTVSVKESWCSEHVKLVYVPTLARRFRPR